MQPLCLAQLQAFLRLNPNRSSVAESDNNLNGIYNTHVDNMSAELAANWCQLSSQTTKWPSKFDASCVYFEGQRPFGHALEGSLTMLCKPLRAGLIKASQLKRSRGGRLGSLASEVERSSCFEPFLGFKTGHIYIIVPSLTQFSKEVA